MTDHEFSDEQLAVLYMLAVITFYPVMEFHPDLWWLGIPVLTIYGIVLLDERRRRDRRLQEDS